MPFSSLFHAKIISKSPLFDQTNRAAPMQLPARALSVKIAMALWVGLIAVHFVIWLIVAQQMNETLTQILSHWDAGWYIKIARDGFDAASAAFLPAFPLLLGLLSAQHTDAMVWLGVGLSTLFFALALWLLIHRPPAAAQPSLWALFVLIFSPASYVFHSVHTEALFLLLSVLAFRQLQQRQFWAAAAWAGLASLIRHQGVFLAIAIAWGAAEQTEGGWRRLRNFALVGVISALLWSATPLFHLWQGRSAFPAFSAHSQHWFLADSVASYFKTFILANPIQNYRFGSFLHHGYFLLLLGASFLLWFRRYKAEAVYCLLSLLIMPLQGEFVDSFRFGAVLFPALFLLGDGLARSHLWLRWGLVSLSVALNLVVCWQYGIARWAY